MSGDKKFLYNPSDWESCLEAYWIKAQNPEYVLEESDSVLVLAIEDRKSVV